MRNTILLLIVMLLASAHAASYQLSVTREGSNLYRVDGQDIYVETRFCYEHVYYQNATLSGSGQYGEITFESPGYSSSIRSPKKCDVVGRFGAISVNPGSYEVTVSRESDDWYEVLEASIFIKTSLMP